MPDPASPLLKEGPELKPTELDIKQRQTETITDALKLVLDQWKEQSGRDMPVRTQYANSLLRLFVVEAGVAGIVIFLLGFGCMRLDVALASVFFGSVFSQVAVGLLVVVRYLFPSDSNKVAIEQIKAIAQVFEARGR